MEEDMVIIKRFKRFLKEKGVYVLFLKEFRRQTEQRLKWADDFNTFFYSVPNETFIDYCLKLIDKKRLIQFAFAWNNDSDWLELSEIWKNVIEMWDDCFNIK